MYARKISSLYKSEANISTQLQRNDEFKLQGDVMSNDRNYIKIKKKNNLHKCLREVKQRNEVLLQGNIML